MTDYGPLFEKIQHAHEVLKGIAKRTPLDRSSTFSRLAEADVYLKLENLQKTGSFKVRGAAYAISQLNDKQKAAGVIAASAGNHAQGVAFAATSLGIKSTIVMPAFSSVAKIQATKSYGADVVLHGSAFDDALAMAREIARETGATFVHPFNDEDVIAGQGTIGLEIIEDLPDVEVVTVPVGGGGLASGIAVAVKHLKPDVRIIGVEAASAAALKESFKAQKPVMIDGLDTMADGIAVKQPGDLTYRITHDLLDDVVTVEELEITRTLFLLLERAKIVVEPAGCVGLTALHFGKMDVRGRKCAAVLSGGNVDMSMMARIVEKELFRLGRSVHLRGVVLDRVGTLNRVLQIVAESGVNVIDIRHDRSDPGVAPNKAEILMVLEVPDGQALKQLLVALDEKGMHFEPYED